VGLRRRMSGRFPTQLAEKQDWPWSSRKGRGARSRLFGTCLSDEKTGFVDKRGEKTFEPRKEMWGHEEREQVRSKSNLLACKRKAPSLQACCSKEGHNWEEAWGQGLAFCSTQSVYGY